jgi:RNA polymerase sigma-70 factor (ECF subfamily)
MAPMSKQRSHLFRELFERNKRDLLAYFTRRVGSDDASDLLQETFARALRRQSFHEVADPPAFLQRIATNLMRDLSRRRRSEQAVIEAGRVSADAPSQEERPEDRIDFERQSRRLAAAMEELPPRSREVLTLAIHHGLSVEAIAERLGITENAVRKQLRRAILRCRAAAD